MSFLKAHGLCIGLYKGLILCKKTLTPSFDHIQITLDFPSSLLNHNSDNTLLTHHDDKLQSLYTNTTVTMKSSSYMVTALYLAGVSSSFMIRGWSEANCGGTAQEINVWDNTCATWPDSFRSFTVMALGANRQLATFYQAYDCNILAGGYWEYRAGGDDPNFQVGDTCITLPYSANAAGSRARP
jgi:hypothetical protein